MSVITQIRRLNTIVTKIRYNPGISKQALIEAVEEKTDSSYSNRTFHRDLNFLTNELKYFIHYDTSKGGYVIDALERSPDEEEFMNKSLAIFDTHNALTELDANQEFVDLSMSQSDLLNPILKDLIQALKQKRKIHITYQKINSDSNKDYMLSPLMLKEYDYKWYLMADDDGVLKSFALGRILEVEILNDKSDTDLLSECKDKLDCALGVSMLNDDVHLVRIAATKKQAKYLKAYPIHHSQELEEENGDVAIFRLHLIVNNELIMKILSYGGTVRVIGPARLYDKVVEMVDAMRNNIATSQINIDNAHRLFMG